MKILIFVFVFFAFAFFIYLALIIIYRFRNISLLKGNKMYSFKNSITDFFNYIKRYVLEFNKKFTNFKRYENIKLLLDRLNLKKSISTENFLIFEQISFLFGAVLFYFMFENFILSMLAGVVGFFAPELILKTKVKQKDENILRVLPDAIDIISASIEGGLSIVKAIARYAERNKNDLSEELILVLNNINLGKSFSEAMQDMNNKLKIKDVTGFINVFIHADKFGGNIKEIIRAQADEIRVKRFQTLKRKAHEAPVKLLIPLIIFIFPVVFIVLFGPVIIKLMSGM